MPECGYHFTCVPVSYPQPLLCNSYMYIMISVHLHGWPSMCGKHFDVVILMGTISVIIVKLCFMEHIELYLLIPCFVTLTSKWGQHYQTVLDSSYPIQFKLCVIVKHMDWMVHVTVLLFFCLIVTIFKREMSDAAPVFTRAFDSWMCLEPLDWGPCT